MKIILSILLFMCLIVAGFVFYVTGYSLALREYLNRDFQPNLEFSFSSCSGSSDSTSIDQSTSLKWIGNETLEIKGGVSPACGTVWLFGGYRINGGELTLTYSPISANILACSCTYRVEYLISDIPKTEYDIRIIEEGGIYEPPEFLMNLIQTLYDYF